jgi:hypothetical protein
MSASTLRLLHFSKIGRACAHAKQARRNLIDRCGKMLRKGEDRETCLPGAPTFRERICFNDWRRGASMPERQS